MLWTEFCVKISLPSHDLHVFGVVDVWMMCVVFWARSPVHRCFIYLAVLSQDWAVLHPQSGLSTTEGMAPVPGQHLGSPPQHARIIGLVLEP